MKHRKRTANTLYTSTSRRLPAGGVLMLLLILVGLLGCGRETTRFDTDAGRDLPAILGSASSAGTEVQASVELRPGKTTGQDKSIPHIVATVQGSGMSSLAAVSAHYNILHFPGSSILTEDQYAEVQAKITDLLKGNGNGLTRSYKAGESGQVELAVPIHSFADLDEALPEYVFLWGVGATGARDGNSLNSSVAGSFVFDGERIYSLTIPEDK